MIRVAFDTWILGSQGMGCKNALYSPKKYHYSEILKLGGVLILLTFDTQSRKCPSLLEMFKGYSGPMGNFRIWSVQINFLYKVTLRIITYGLKYITFHVKVTVISGSTPFTLCRLLRVALRRFLRFRRSQCFFSYHILQQSPIWTFDYHLPKPPGPGDTRHFRQVRRFRRASVPSKRFASNLW